MWAGFLKMNVSLFYICARLKVGASNFPLRQAANPLWASLRTRGGVNVWTGSGDVAVIYKNRSEVGKHLFEVSGTVQQCNDF